MKRISAIILAAALIIVAAGLAPFEAAARADTEYVYGGQFLNLREQPNKNSRSLGGFYDGTKLTTLYNSVDGNWSYVRIGYQGSGTIEGWMSRSYLSYYERDNRVAIYRQYNKPLAIYRTKNKSNALRTLPAGTEFHVIGFTISGTHYDNNREVEELDGWWFVKAIDPDNGNLYSGYVDYKNQ